ncbi:MAG TPA: HAD family hydrolase [Candidatus Caldiarchaeum subterraneum]|uniref:HAD family hydrolase n=1 Tax=Caldiarchaeum subterraneum TaxID=311458 RepID=A0A833ECK4_CALS0|nr:HAD family hydrolase [Aigarchaeota archaeon]HIQ30334.1 HAD family hydrolase [Candidatus Caldarchaeum subterraneum]
MLTRRFKVVSLDFGGTLAYEVEEEYITLLKVLKKLGLDFRGEEIRKIYEEEKQAYESSQHNGVWTEKTHIELVSGILRRLGIEDSKTYAEKVCSLYPEVIDVRKFEDVDDALKMLREEGYMLIIISNITSEARLRKLLQRLGIIGFFQHLIASGSVGYEKPDSRIFLHACNLAGVRPQELVHVGDSYEHDCKGARSVGAFPLLIDRGNRYGGVECLKVNDLRNVKASLEKAL